MKFFIILSIFCFSMKGYAQDSKSIVVDVLLDSAFLKKLSVSEKFINVVDYTADGFLLLSSPNQFYLLGIGDLIPVFEKWTGEGIIESFAVTTDDSLLLISGKTLYKVYSEPSFIKVTDIPDNNMGITSKHKDIYVFDRTLKSDKRDYSIYQVSEDGGITPLVSMPAPILSVFEQPSRLVFSVNNILFGIDVKTRILFQIFVLKGRDDIISIVADTINHAFYFSTNNAIYRMKEGLFESISEDLGGILRYDGEGLLVFNPEKQFIIRLRNNLLYPTKDDKDIN